MSGGHFNYICHKVDDPCEMLSRIDDLDDMVSYLQGLGRNEAAAEILAYIARLDAFREQVQQMAIVGSRLYRLTKAAEWVASSDSIVEEIDRALEALKADAR